MTRWLKIAALLAAGALLYVAFQKLMWTKDHSSDAGPGWGADWKD